MLHLLFHDDPYMKVKQAYYAKELPIPPPTIVPPSLMLTPMFKPQEFILPEELLPLKKQGHDRSSSSTSVLPQAFEIEESSQDKIEGLGKGRQLENNSKISLARFRIANLEQIIEDIQHKLATMANANNSNWSPEREAPVARKCSYKDFISCQSFNFKGSEGAVGFIRWFERTESVFSRSNCTEDCKVKFAMYFNYRALYWWNSLLPTYWG
ncbi:hypothetical protein Tco_0910568 [Tanacetum coccineum]|uniref:Reverse transcriptase domain-containing protein n=1 Tax=Tanacetum coccineum TaxID=301880 RepID=A0ABQ5CTP8_9ASTR